MALRILKLFRPTAHAARDGLSQPQREAIADLLHYCMYADKHLALAEEKIIEDVVATFDWDPRIAFEHFEALSIAKARRAKEDPQQRAAFFSGARERLGTDAARQQALDACEKLLAAGGTTAEESQVLVELRAALAAR